MDESYVEALLSLVERVPPGRVTTYGALARAVGSGGPRQVGRVMALHGDAVPWWRVVRADGRPATCHGGTALEHLRAEGVPLRDGGRVDLAAAVRAGSSSSGVDRLDVDATLGGEEHRDPAVGAAQLAARPPNRGSRAPR